jgi:hypothetical protein
MGFGLDTGISRNTNNSVQIAEKTNSKGAITGMTSYGGKSETTEEAFDDSITNAAINGQSGTTIVSGHNLIESNVDYAKSQKTTVVALATSA